MYVHLDIPCIPVVHDDHSKDMPYAVYWLTLLIAWTNEEHLDESRNRFLNTGEFSAKKKRYHSTCITSQSYYHQVSAVLLADGCMGITRVRRPLMVS